MTTSMNNTETTIIEFWFIPLDIIGILFACLIILISTLFLLVIIIDKTCHTIPMLLVGNSCLSELVLGINIIGMHVFTIKNDLSASVSTDTLCFLRGYLSYSLCALENYSYLLQAIYRYIIVVYPNRLFWQSQRTQLILISSTWIFALLFPLAFFFTGDIVYNIDNQICQVPLRLSFVMIYLSSCIYFVPIVFLSVIYYKLVQYVREMNRRVILVNTILRAQNELKMVRRTAILAGIIFTIEFPYALFLFISFFTTPPQYHFRIAWIFVDLSLVAVLIALFQFTDPLRASIKKIFQIWPNGIMPTST